VKGSVVWFTGLPGSGKTTLANRVRAVLRERGVQCSVLDSDEVRDAIVPRPDYSEAGRDGFYATLANLAVMLAEQDVVVLVAATAHRRAFRDRARAAAESFVEIYVDTPVEVCQQRDFKGLYAAKPETLPGVGVDYEPPISADVTAHGGNDEQAVERIVALASG
jgi:adenylylsulfate kinase